MTIDKNNLLSRIRKYQEAQTRAARAAEQKAKADLDEAINACWTPATRQELTDILQIANAAAAAGIDLAEFTADSDRYRLGFIRPNNQNLIEYVGFVMDGTCENTDLWVGAEGPVGVKLDRTSPYLDPEFKRPVIHHLKDFVSQWPDFKSRFYAYLDEICPNTDI